MNPKGLAHAIAAIERELDNLKAHAGLPSDTGEEADDLSEEVGEPETKTIGRGRKQRTVPTLGEGLMGKPKKDEES